VAVFNSMNQVQYSGGNNIYLPNYGYATGEEVTFESTGNVTGLSSGTDYYVIDIDANDFELAANYCDTGIEVAACAEFNGPMGSFSGWHPVKVVGLSPNYSQSGEQVVNTFYVTGQAPIGGLTNGGVYYVVGLTGSSFEVALTPNGAAISLNGSNSDNAESLFQAYYAGLYSVGSGTGELVEDISASSGSQSFTGVPGIPVAGVSTGDGERGDVGHHGRRHHHHRYRRRQRGHHHRRRRCLDLHRLHRQRLRQRRQQRGRVRGRQRGHGQRLGHR
jgi:hypothetical protein